MSYPSVYNQKTVIITGAASGIGKELATLLNEQKAKLYLLDLNEEGLQELSKKLRQFNPNVFTFSLDVSDHKSYESFYHEFLKNETCPDYLFNNAGIGLGGETKDFPFQSWRKIIDVNLFGTVNGIHFFYPLMVENKKGHIVNTSSLAGLVPLPGESSYVASKYAIQGLTEVLEIEASFYNVKVTAVCPGVIQTPIYDTGEVIGMDKDKVLKLWPKGISAEKCAQIILKGVAKNKRTIVVTSFAKAVFLAKRYFPSLLRKAFIHYFSQVRKSN